MRGPDIEVVEIECFPFGGGTTEQCLRQHIAKLFGQFVKCRVSAVGFGQTGSGTKPLLRIDGQLRGLEDLDQGGEGIASPLIAVELRPFEQYAPEVFTQGLDLLESIARVFDGCARWCTGGGFDCAHRGDALGLAADIEQQGDQFEGFTDFLTLEQTGCMQWPCRDDACVTALR